VSLLTEEIIHVQKYIERGRERVGAMKHDAIRIYMMIAAW